MVLSQPLARRAIENVLEQKRHRYGRCVRERNRVLGHFSPRFTAAIIYSLGAKVCSPDAQMAQLNRGRGKLNAAGLCASAHQAQALAEKTAELALIPERRALPTTSASQDCCAAELPSQ